MGISTMWSDGRHLEGIFSGYDDSFVLLKMPGGGKCVFNSDWVLDGAYKDWLQVVKGINMLRIANCAAESLN